MTMKILCIWGQRQNCSKTDTLPTMFPVWWEYCIWNWKVYVENVDTALNWSDVGVREEHGVRAFWISPSFNPWKGPVEKINFLYRVSLIERIPKIKLINCANTDTMWVKGLRDWRRLSNSHKWGPDVVWHFKNMQSPLPLLTFLILWIVQLRSMRNYWTRSLFSMVSSVYIKKHMGKRIRMH